jgi:hypothetical protein
VPYHLTHAERRKYEAAGVVGVLSDRGERARPGQHRALPEQQHREHTMAYPTRFTRIENLGEGLHQRRHRRTGLGAASTAIASSRSTSICSRAATIGDTDNAGTGLSEVIKDFDTLMITSDPCPSWHLRPHVAAVNAHSSQLCRNPGPILARILLPEQKRANSVEVYWAAAVAVKDHPGRCVAAGDGHREGIGDQAGAHVLGQLPAHHQSSDFRYVSSTNQRSPATCRLGRAASINSGVNRSTHRYIVT